MTCFGVTVKRFFFWGRVLFSGLELFIEGEKCWKGFIHTELYMSQQVLYCSLVLRIKHKVGRRVALWLTHN